MGAVNRETPPHPPQHVSCLLFRSWRAPLQSPNCCWNCSAIICTHAHTRSRVDILDFIDPPSYRGTCTYCRVAVLVKSFFRQAQTAQSISCVFAQRPGSLSPRQQQAPRSQGLSPPRRQQQALAVNALLYFDTTVQGSRGWHCRRWVPAVGHREEEQ